jgi:NAD(P)-dependent dehydrogenase (short-subunit alcohol dehydrogenase family)
MRGLEGKVVVITGGASGLGRSMAKRLLEEGSRVVITDVQEHLGRQAAADIGAVFVEQDVTDEAGWETVLSGVIDRYGALHALVNNAGITNPPGSDVEHTRVADWRRIFAVNVEGAFLGCQSALRRIGDSGGGSIVNISSIAGLLAMPFGVAYGASKAALRHLTKSVAQYSLEQRLAVRCNSVHPGLVRTPPWEEWAVRTSEERGISVDEAFAEVATAVPMGEFTTKEDVAATVAFLVSDDARHITGENIAVDGGLVHADTFYNQVLTGRN